MKRQVFELDSLEYLGKINDHSFDVVLTSPPDVEELIVEGKPNESVEYYEEWVRMLVDLSIQAVTEEGYVILWMTDRKWKGQLLSKMTIAADQAKQCGAEMVWHKVVCRLDPGKTSLHRVGFTNIVCFSVKGKSGKALPDVIPPGEKVYVNGMDSNALEVIFDFIEQKFPGCTLLDPCCGKGAALAWANQRGMNAVGVEIDPDMVQLSKDAAFDVIMGSKDVEEVHGEAEEWL